MIYNLDVQPTRDSLNKLWHIHMMEYQAATKKPILEKYLRPGEIITICY